LSSNNTIVIIGAGQAGGWAAHTLRSEGYAGRITLLGDEPHRPYERPPLSKAVMLGDADPQSTQLMKPEAFDALDLDWRPNTRVSRIDRAGKRVELGQGESIAYDKLIFCTGGRARMLSIPGADLPNVHTLRTLDDAKALGAVLQPGRHVVVVGGGWIGLEVAASARKRGAQATVVEAQSRVCERAVTKDVSAYLYGLHLAHGVEIMLQAQVQAFHRQDDGRLRVELADGRSVPADAIVVGVGLIANDELAKEAGVECNNGVLVDAGCRTSDADIFAAGDVAVTPNPWAGRSMRLESWQNAQEQGMAAARAALGQAVDYRILPWFWSDQYDSNMQIYGMSKPTHSIVRRGDTESGSFVLFYLDGNVVQAAVGVNAARDLRFARRLIEQRKPVDTGALSDTSLPMQKI
jgi:3-phenylpropionate/trans-cinnamate dioxygenase ferredoxin reductase subunit